MSSRPHEPTALSRRSMIQGLAAVGIGASALSACGSEKPKLSLAIFPDYLGETTLADFHRATGIDVAVTTVASNEELYARLRAGNHGFDLVVLASQWVERLVREDLLAELSHVRLPNLNNLEPAFNDMPYDPGNAHSVPYTWMALGIGYRKSKLPQPPTGWKDLLEASNLAGRIALPADPNLAFRIAAKALGFPANLFNPDRVAQATDALTKTAPRVKSWYDDGGQDLLKDQVDAVALWNADLVQVALEDPDIGFVLPKEGALLSCDCLAIPAHSSRPENAHKFIDYVLGAEGGAGVAGTLWFPTPNAAARAILPAEYRTNPVLFPPDRPAGTSEFIGDNPALDAQFAEAFKRIAPAVTSSGNSPGTAP